jgi:BirA family biotin operon repressor/biotin-[acetyl-CoA-carboxylase] ligase
MNPGGALWRVERLAVAASTNELALRRVSEAFGRGAGPPVGLVITAERQTAGRGQHGRAWQSPPGGLYLSAIVGDVPAETRDRFALVAGCAAIAALEALDAPQTHIWWPNDLFIGGKKVGGILCESFSCGEAWVVVVGMGINVQTQVVDLPADLQGRATSLAAEGLDVSPRKVETAFLAALAETLEVLREDGLDPVLRRLRRHDGLRGKSLVLRAEETLYEGRGAGISDTGELLLKMEGSTRAFAQGTVLSVEGRALRG